MDQVNLYCSVKGLRIKLIRINLTDQLDPYDLRNTLTYTHNKYKKRIGAVLVFLEQFWYFLKMLGAPSNTQNILVRPFC